MPLYTVKFNEFTFAVLQTQMPNVDNCLTGNPATLSVTSSQLKNCLNHGMLDSTFHESSATQPPAQRDGHSPCKFYLCCPLTWQPTNDRLSTQKADFQLILEPEKMYHVRLIQRVHLLCKHGTVSNLRI